MDYVMDYVMVAVRALVYSFYNSLSAMSWFFCEYNISLGIVRMNIPFPFYYATYTCIMGCCK